MPFVKSYFRRSAGMAGAAGSAPVRKLDVAIYGADGVSLLREGTGGRGRVENLTFDSGLPGGFLSASFWLANPTARSWPGRPGLRTIIRRGNRVLWWGWIEDIRRSVRGGIEGLQVTAFGPWQQLQQRLCSPNYSGTIYGDAAIAQELAAYCPDISGDYSALQGTSVNVAPLAWTNQPVSDLVKVVCEAGNSAGKQMLFAVWEPSGRSTHGYPTPMNANPGFEESSAGSVPAGWNWYSIGGYTLGSPVWQTAISNSPAHGYRLNRSGSSGTVSMRLSTDPWVTGITPGTTYTVDWWCYFGAVASISVYARCNWYTAADGLISQVAGTTRNSTGSAFSARYVESFTAPANAAKLRLDILVTLPDSGANAFVVLDDVYLYLPGTAIELDRRPLTHLWPRDLSGWDYLLFTSELDAALDVTETTRTLANYVVGKYGSSFTAGAADATSQGLYRRRDGIADAGSASATVAAAMRDAYLALHKDPMMEPGSFKLGRPGAVRSAHGVPVWPEELRAGDRLKIADGPLAGQVMLLTRVSYEGGAVSCTPERSADVPLLLAKNVKR